VFVGIIFGLKTPTKISYKDLTILFCMEPLMINMAVKDQFNPK